MKSKIVFGLFAVLVLFVGQASASPPHSYSEEIVSGTTNGNHDLDCTIIRPWSIEAGPESTQYPVIVWANGWGQGDKFGANVTAGYKPGLIEWALDGPYIVIAANQWSPTESDVLACLQWIIDQNTTVGSEYEGIVNTARIGLAGHSQGAGAAIKAGDGEPNGFDISGVIAMNPYGPSWVDAGKQDGPVLAILGSEDITVPVSWFDDAWAAIQSNDQGGVYTVLQGANHSDDAWGPEGENPEDHNFGRFQKISELWWQYILNDKATAGRTLKRVFGKAPWVTEFSFTDNFELP